MKWLACALVTLGLCGVAYVERAAHRASMWQSDESRAAALMRTQPLEAARIYKHLALSDSEHASSWRNNHATAILQAGLIDEAEREFADLMAEGHDSSIGMGVVLMRRGLPREAAVCFYGHSDRQLVLALAAAHEYAEARDVQSRLLTRDPLTWHNYGCLVDAAGGEFDFYAVAAMFEPDDPAARVTLQTLASMEADEGMAERIRAQADYLAGG